MKKRGSAHVEMIISFVLFAGFTFFLLAYITPQDNSFLEDSILIGFKDSFFENTTVNFSTVLVNKTGEICQPTQIVDNSISRNTTRQWIYYVYGSSEFIDNVSVCNYNNYSLGFLLTEEVVSNASLKNLEALYVANYDLLKTQFEIPSTVDFGLTVSGYNFPKQVPENVRVLAVTYKKKLLYANGTVENKDFIFKIW